MKQYFSAIATIVGTIVGAGIFALPFAFARAGLLGGFFYLLVVGGIVLVIYWLFGEVILRTRGEHRFVGYARRYLGKRGKVAASFSTLFGFFGSLVVYLILGGDFLRILLGGFLGGDNLLWSFVFFALGSLAIFIGLRVISIVELLTGFLLILVVLFLFFKSWPFLPTTDFSFTFNWPAHFLAYGVVFYSLLGSSALMEARQMLRGREKKFKMAIFWGLAIPVAIYAVFALAVVSVSGPKTTPDAISGLVPFLGPGVVALGAFFGVVAVFSSYIVLGVCLRKVFQFDFGFSRLNAWIIVSFVPLILFLAGAKNLLLVIGLVGIVMGGLEGVLTILIYRRADRHGNRRPEYDVFVPKIVLWLLVAIFVLGMAYQLWMLK